MERNEVIVLLIKAYLDLPQDSLNKNEIKKGLKGEMATMYDMKEEEISDFLFDDWLYNYMRTDLETKLKQEFGHLMETPKSSSEPVWSIKLKDKK